MGSRSLLVVNTSQCVLQVSKYSLIETIVIVINLLASLKLCNLAVKLLPEPFQKKPRPLASSHLLRPYEAPLTILKRHSEPRSRI